MSSGHLSDAVQVLVVFSVGLLEVLLDLFKALAILFLLPAGIGELNERKIKNRDVSDEYET